MMLAVTKCTAQIRAAIMLNPSHTALGRVMPVAFDSLMQVGRGMGVESMMGERGGGFEPIIAWTHGTHKEQCGLRGCTQCLCLSLVRTLPWQTQQSLSPAAAQPFSYGTVLRIDLAPNGVVAVSARART